MEVSYLFVASVFGIFLTLLNPIAWKQFALNKKLELENTLRNNNKDIAIKEGQYGLNAVHLRNTVKDFKDKIQYVLGAHGQLYGQFKGSDIYIKKQKQEKETISNLNDEILSTLKN
jgi:hypothetical protein